MHLSLTETTPRQTAVSLLGDGLWPVIIQAGKKAPIGLAWGSTRPTVQSLNEAYWNHPGAGVGLLLGPRGGVIDVECDGPEGEESLRRLTGGVIILTCGWVSTRGKHRLYRYTQDFEALGRSIVKSDEFPDLELRLGFGDRQIQSVVPPTMGRRWNGIREIARMGGEVIGKLVEERGITRKNVEERGISTSVPPSGNGRTHIADILMDRAIQRASKYLEACDGAVSGSGGHNTTFRVVCHAGPGFGLDPDTCLHLLTTIYNPKCQPPWSIKELEHKVLDAYETETRRGWLYEQEKRN